MKQIEPNNGFSGNETMKQDRLQPNYDQQLTEITTTITQLKEQVSLVSTKILRNYEERGDSNDVREAEIRKPTQPSYADVIAIVKHNQHAVFIKPNDGANPTDGSEITSTLKKVPIVTAKLTQQKPMNLVFPTASAKDRAIEALETNNQIADNHQIISWTKLKPKISIAFIPDNIKDSEAVQSIQDKS